MTVPTPSSFIESDIDSGEMNAIQPVSEMKSSRSLSNVSVDVDIALPVEASVDHSVVQSAFVSSTLQAAEIAETVPVAFSAGTLQNEIDSQYKTNTDTVDIMHSNAESKQYVTDHMPNEVSTTVFHTQNYTNNNTPGLDSHPAVESESLRNITESLAVLNNQVLGQKIQESRKALEDSVATALSKWTEQLAERAEQRVSRTLVNMAGLKLSGEETTDNLRHRVKETLEQARNGNDDVLAELVATHARQIKELKEQMSVERKAHARLIQQVEKGLTQRYDEHVESLKEKVASANERKLQMAMEYMERSARQDSEKAMLLHQQMNKAESTASQRFKTIVTELHKSWEEEERLRSVNLQQQQQAHFQAVLHHMEAQLDLSLRAQSDADKQWLEDLDARNQSNAETLLKFEAKCKKVYDARFQNYVVKTSRRFKEYEEQFLATGRTLANEKLACESQINRMKLALSQWKTEYQRDIKRRYDDAVEVMQTRYQGEIDRLMSELNDARQQTAQAVKSMADEHANMMHNNRVSNASSSVGGNQAVAGADIGRLCADLKDTWNSVKVPVEERIIMLTQLINECPVTPQFLHCYDELTSKLHHRLSANELLNKQKYLEYRIQQLSQRKEDSHEMQNIQAQLAAVAKEASNAVLEYEKKYQQKLN